MSAFYEKTIAEGSTKLSEEESKHCAQVLRKKEGNRITIFDGIGGIYEAVLVSVNKKSCEFEVLEKSQREPKNFRIHLAIAPTKNIDRIEWMVEKLGELGVDEITFLKTEYSERTKLRLDRLERKAVSAMKQSRYPYLMKLNDVAPFNEFVKNCASEEKWIAHVDRTHKYLGDVVMAGKNATMLIGPEGDFSLDEVEMAKKSGFGAVSLGATTLRTETAGLAACHLINVINKF